MLLVCEPHVEEQVLGEENLPGKTGASALGEGFLILDRTADTRRNVLFEVVWGSGLFYFQSPPPWEGVFISPL